MHSCVRCKATCRRRQLQVLSPGTAGLVGGPAVLSNIRSTCPAGGRYQGSMPSFITVFLLLLDQQHDHGSVVLLFGCNHTRITPEDFQDPLRYGSRH